MGHGQMALLHDINMLDQIKAEMEELAGVSRQRMGQITSSELVGNTERAVSQSSHITEYWFAHHDEVKRRVYEALIDVAKIAWKGKKKMQYVLSDMSRVFIDLEDGMFHDTAYGIFITNASKDVRALESLRMTAQQAMQNGSMKAASFAQMMQTDSIAEITRELEKTEDMTEMRQQQQAQADRESQEKIAQMQQDAVVHKEEREDLRTDKNNQTKIDVAMINANAKLVDTDLNNNGVADTIDREKVILEDQRENRKIDNEATKQADDRATKDRELEIKQEEVDVKRIAAKKNTSN